MSERDRGDKFSLFVRGFSDNVTQDQLRDLFQQHGNVKDVYIVLDRHTNKRRGYAYIELESREQLDSAMSLHGTEFNSRKLQVEIARGSRKTANEMRDRERGRRRRSRRSATCAC